MTQQQKDDLSFHVALHKPILKIDGSKTYWLNHGEIIEFTNFVFYSQNVKFEINHDEYREIWLSQFTDFFLTDDLEVFSSIIVFKGEEGKPIRNYDMNELCELLRNKKFQVHLDTRGKYVFNKKSDVWDTVPLKTYPNAYEYVKKCVDNNRIGEIGTLLKISNCYHLCEI